MQVLKSDVGMDEKLIITFAPASNNLHVKKHKLHVAQLNWFSTSYNNVLQ